MENSTVHTTTLIILRPYLSAAIAKADFICSVLDGETEERWGKDEGRELRDRKQRTESSGQSKKKKKHRWERGIKSIWCSYCFYLKVISCLAHTVGIFIFFPGGYVWQNVKIFAIQ